MLNLPAGTVRRRFGEPERVVLYVQRASRACARVLPEAEAILRLLRKLPPDADNDFTLSTAEQIIATFDSLSARIGLVTVGLAAVSLLIGAIGIANVMFISVTERTREIGLRLAVGARRRQVRCSSCSRRHSCRHRRRRRRRSPPWPSALLLTLVVSGFSAVPPLWAVAAGLTASVCVGIAAGYWPAQRPRRWIRSRRCAMSEFRPHTRGVPMLPCAQTNHPPVASSVACYAVKMSRTGLTACLILSFAAVVASARQRRRGRVALTIEGLSVWQQRNDVRIPPDTGTEFSLADLVGSARTPSVRVEATVDVTERQQIRLVFAPLQLTGRGTPALPIAFAGTTFAPAPTDAVYKFNSYRATWSYRVHQGRTWTWRVGFTGFVRDARVALNQGDRTAEDTDVGFVPLGHVSAELTGRALVRRTQARRIRGATGPRDRLRRNAGISSDPAIEGVRRLSDNRGRRRR